MKRLSELLAQYHADLLAKQPKVVEPQEITVYNVDEPLFFPQFAAQKSQVPIPLVINKGD